MIRALFAATLAIFAGVVIFTDHQILMGVAMIFAGACVMCWPSKYPKR